MVGPVIFDAVKRYLVYSGYDVTLVVNVTDVDDKLIAESNSRGVPMSQLAAEMTTDYMHNLEALGVDSIDHFPRCTETMDEIVKFTSTLIEKGFAYEVEGDVYFEVGKCPGYGKLSHREVEALQGDGGGMAQRKRASADFALWKSAKPGEPSWPSPWGQGRPGWHIECSAMSRLLLGETFDIHGGGLDLMFPHHENEIAQSECCHGRPMAKYWMHNGLMQASSEVGKVGGRNTRAATEGDLASQEAGKISKSKGSEPFREMLKQFSGETIRFFVLSSHYRRPIDFSERRLHEVETGMDTFHRFFKRFERLVGKSYYELAAPASRKEGDFVPGDDPLLKVAAEHRNRFLEAMDDDFNTARRHRGAFRSGPGAEQVRRRRETRRPAATDARKTRIAGARHGRAARTRHDARPIPQSAAGADRRGRRLADRQADGAVDRTASRVAQEERLRHRRSDSQSSDRNRRCPRRPSRRNGVEQEIVISGQCDSKVISYWPLTTDH